MCVDFSKDSKCPKLKFTSPWDFNWAYNDSTEKYYAGAFTDKNFVAKKATVQTHGLSFFASRIGLWLLPRKSGQR